MKAFVLGLLAIMFSSIAIAQVGQKHGVDPAPATAAGPAPEITDTITAYLLPDDLKLSIRAGQLEWDELEIENQKMLLKVEQNKARQREVSDAIRVAAFQFSKTKQIDLKAWELSAKELKFVKKKAATK